MVEEKGDIKVKQDTRIVAAHFRCQDQFMGFSGSFGPSHDICLGSEADDSCVAETLLLPACFSSSEIEAALSGFGVETAGDAILPG